MAETKGGPPEADGPERPLKALTLRVVTELGTEEEVMELFERNLQPWFDQLPVDVTVLDVDDADEQERSDRLGE